MWVNIYTGEIIAPIDFHEYFEAWLKNQYNISDYENAEFEDTEELFEQFKVSEGWVYENDSEASN